MFNYTSRKKTEFKKKRGLTQVHVYLIISAFDKLSQSNLKGFDSATYVGEPEFSSFLNSGNFCNVG
mgnify:CR=1 FL=1